MLTSKQDKLVYYWLFERDQRLSEEQIRPGVDDENPVPGDADPKKQIHIFDFDDTLGVTQDSNGMMLFRNGEPAWKTKEEAEAWVKQNGLDHDLLKGHKGSPIEQPEGMSGFAVYVNSAGLSSAKKTTAKHMYTPNLPSPGDPKSEGDVLVIDFSPSSTAKTAEPIGPSIEKMKQANSQGSETQVITARSGESSIASGEKKVPKDFAGKEHPPSVEKDLADFLQKQGVTPKNRANTPVKGMGGGNKGDQIKKTYFSGDPESHPDEVHFYDDDGDNINKVRNALQDVDAEVFLYGPGGFSDEHPHPQGKANANDASEKYPTRAKEKKKAEPAQQELPLKESRSLGDLLTFDVARWQRMAGIKR